jgi:hypothetical protein
VVQQVGSLSGVAAIKSTSSSGRPLAVHPKQIDEIKERNAEITLARVMTASQGTADKIALVA